MTLTALNCLSLSLHDAAVRPTIAAIRAEHSILWAETSVCVDRTTQDC
ncbi:MAG: hypothetical protein OSA51_13805 [Octadecabacter sp.]|nr:hypothetical protein [Octadecabacter sp.]